ncbi:MAG: hypothetical protein C0609_00770 [Deltaproteobacteria bacterium]|nr:MAG: hypothetical protein C0609_00770 [Deltaproteobacteria bacterium]
MKEDTLEILEQKLDELMSERDEREANLPAHSIRPHQLLIIEELTERIDELKMRIDALKS